MNALFTHPHRSLRSVVRPPAVDTHQDHAHCVNRLLELVLACRGDNAENNAWPADLHAVRLSPSSSPKQTAVDLVCTLLSGRVMYIKVFFSAVAAKRWLFKYRSLRYVCVVVHRMMSVCDVYWNFYTSFEKVLDENRKYFGYTR